MIGVHDKFTNEPRHRLPWPGRGLLAKARDAKRWFASGRAIESPNRGLKRDAPTLFFYPMRPDPMARITLIVAHLGWRIARWSSTAAARPGAGMTTPRSPCP